MKIKKCLVTGGGGFLGFALVKKLLELGYQVRTVSRNRYKKLKKLGVEQVIGNIKEPSLVERACDGVDAIFHTAAKTNPWGRYSDFYETNVVGTENLIAAALAAGVTAFIHTSSPSVIAGGHDLEGVDESYPFPEKFHSSYGETKALAEQRVFAAAKGGLPAIVLRPHAIWGPGDTTLVPRILARADRMRQIGDGKNLLDTIYIDNAVDAHIKAMRKLSKKSSLSGNCYFVCQGEPVKLWELIDRILSWTGKSISKKPLSHKKAYTVASILEAVYKVFRIKSEPFITRYVVDELSTSHWFSLKAIERDLGFKAAVSVEEGLKLTEKWVKKQYKIS